MTKIRFGCILGKMLERVHFNEGRGMKSFRLGRVVYSSRSAAAVALAKRSKRSASEIARIVGITPQTVKFACEKVVGKIDR